MTPDEKAKFLYDGFRSGNCDKAVNGGPPWEDLDPEIQQKLRSAENGYRNQIKGMFTSEPEEAAPMPTPAPAPPAKGKGKPPAAATADDGGEGGTKQDPPKPPNVPQEPVDS